MRLIFLFQLSLLIYLSGAVACGHGFMLEMNMPLQEPALRITERVNTIIADLERYIPGYMQQENIPGVAIALIHGGELVWTKGFGVTNTLICKSMTSESIFEVASNSKVVSA